MQHRLRIAQLVLPWLPVPPNGYGGTEQVVYDLTEGLAARGHEVTLFSVGTSKTSAKLQYIFEEPLGLQPEVMEALKSSFYPWMHVAACFEHQHEFDIIHSHAQFLGLPFAAIAQTPSVHTFHRVYEFVDKDELDLVLRYKRLNFVSISNSQRSLPLNFVATVCNGINTDRFAFKGNRRGDYIFWAGRIIDKKGPEEALLVARKTGLPLVMAGKKTDPDYFQQKIAPLLSKVASVKLVGELTTDEMVRHYQGAMLTLVPVKWNEPFGLIPVESMSCGTPVVGYAKGGLRETVVNGKTGYLLAEADVEKLSKKTQEIFELGDEAYWEMSQQARKHVEVNFSIAHMTQAYEQVYYKVSNSQ